VSLTKTQTLALLHNAALKPKRKFGQNFVVDENTLKKIVRLASVGSGDSVLEIGAGLGALSEALLETGAAVTSLEVDPDLMEILRHRPELNGIRFVEGDALTIALEDIAPADKAPWTVVANLPYNVATPVILRCLEQAPQITRLLIMIQAEVGERLAAHPGDAAYGAVSVRVDYHATAKVVGRIPPTVFVPQPNVESVFVALDRRATPRVEESVASEAEIFTLVRQAFSQRRKMLRRSLAGIVSDAAFAIADVAPTARPEELDVVAFGRLAAAVQ
jgi:16S rRNA (adenine1518-N6/adenine1519-N6)-dimethyltransferase